MAGGFGEREGMLGDTRGGAGVGSCHGARPSAGTLSLGCARSRSWRTITPPQPSPFYSMKGVTFWRAWTWTCDLLCGACAWRGGGQAATPGWRAPEVACVSLGGARGLIIDMILATDMAKHFPFLADFRRLVETRRQQAGGAVDMANATYALARALARCLFSAASALPLRLVFAAASLQSFCCVGFLCREDEKQLLLQAVVHCADLSGPTKPWDVSKVSQLVTSRAHQLHLVSSAADHAGCRHGRNAL